MPTTPEWKRQVDSVLAANRAIKKHPVTRKALAKIVKCDPGGLNRMLDGDQPTYKYGLRICEVLGIEPATIPNPRLAAMSDEEFHREVERIRSLPPAKRKRALTVIRSFLDSLDEE